MDLKLGVLKVSLETSGDQQNPKFIVAINFEHSGFPIFIGAINFGQS